MVTLSLPLKQCYGKCVMGECGCGLARIGNEHCAVSSTELSLPVKTQK